MLKIEKTNSIEHNVEQVKSYIPQTYINLIQVTETNKLHKYISVHLKVWKAMNKIGKL